ncbi:hypothetical protein LR48_Vigan09g117400 [Vigna angularis]|uniref:Uncharacterized protein n=1 Tax=Phaseolus angularis TaxID=3914 RepID=A0A0L9VBT0_PHAAN|nr:hypothetical protein LR48_Vigan09g117400 [Vigna angularis]
MVFARPPIQATTLADHPTAIIRSTGTNEGHLKRTSTSTVQLFALGFINLTTQSPPFGPVSSAVRSRPFGFVALFLHSGTLKSSFTGTLPTVRPLTSGLVNTTNRSRPFCRLASFARPFSLHHWIAWPSTLRRYLANNSASKGFNLSANSSLRDSASRGICRSAILISDGTLEVVIPSFVHYLVVLEGANGDKMPEFVQAKLFAGRDDAWKEREDAVLALGAISEGFTMVFILICWRSSSPNMLYGPESRFNPPDLVTRNFTSKS